MSKRIGLVCLIGSIMALLLGCGEPAEEPTATATAETAPSTETPSAAPTSAATSTTPDNQDFQGELIVVVPGLGLQIMDPAKETRAGGATYQVPMFDNLLGMDYETGAIDPGIAESWSQSPDGLTWSFKLREGLEWHNGDPITAEDIAFSVEYYQSEEATTGGGPFELLEVTTVVHDDLNIDMHTKLNDIFFAGQLSPSGGGQQVMLPKNYIEEVGPATFANNPVGSGPWKFRDSQPGILVQFEAWDHPHWRETPNFELFTLRAVPEESTRVAQLVTGLAGIANIEPSSFQQVADAGLQRVTATGANQSTYVIEGTYTPQMADSPLADVRVREALSLAINRQEIVDFVMEGAANLPLAYGLYRYSQDIDVDYWEQWSAEQFRYDPERARELLAEAGYADGFEFPYWLVSSPGTPWQITVGQAMIGYWEEIGIRTEVRQVEWGVFSPKRREYDPETGAPRELIGTMKNSRAAGRPNTGTRILGELGDCNLYTPLQDPPGGGSAGSYQIKTEACEQIYDLWYSEEQGVLNQTDPNRRLDLFPPAIEYVADLWIAVPVVEGSVNYAVDPDVVGRFAVGKPSGELSDMSSAIPRADQNPW